MTKIHDKYLKAREEDPKLVSLENGALNGSTDEFVSDMGGSRIEDEGVEEEEFLEIEHTPGGYDAHILEEHKDSDGTVRKLYIEERLPLEELGDAVKNLDIGDSVKVHLTGRDVTDLARKREPYVHPVHSESPVKDTYTKVVSVRNKFGIHVRPAAILTKIASSYDCDATATYNGMTNSAKSIMGWMTLGVPSGAEVTLRTKENRSNDALQCLYDLESSFKDKFGED